MMVARLTAALLLSLASGTALAAPAPAASAAAFGNGAASKVVSGSGVAVFRQAAAEPPWLVRLNAYRAMAGAPAVTEDPELSRRAALHVAYMVKTRTLEHRENPASPHYTREGHRSAQNSLLMQGGTGADAIDEWAVAPYHGAGMLTAGLRVVGFADSTAAQGRAALDFRSAARSTQAVVHPRAFPTGPDVPLYGLTPVESPDPYRNCPSRFVPGKVGAPLYAFFGPARKRAPSQAIVTDAAGKTIPTCVLSAATDRNQGGLGEDGTVVLLPLGRYAYDTTYRARVTVEGVTKAWSFTTAKRPVSARHDQRSRTTDSVRIDRR